MEPIFNESFVEKKGLWVPRTVHRTHWKHNTATERASNKKKKKKEARRCLFSSTQTGTHSTVVWCINGVHIDCVMIRVKMSPFRDHEYLLSGIIRLKDITFREHYYL